MDAYFDYIIELAAAYPYLTVATVFVLCGVGLPMPEEIMLILAGYATYKSDGEVSLPLMMVVCFASILAGDIIPFGLGRTFGTRLLRLRLLRYWATKDRLVVFDRWFSKHGDYVILIARFVAGFRVIAFFTAGTMKMSWRRFLILDGSGIAIIVPPLTWLAYRFGDKIDWVIDKAKEVEQGILYGAGAAVAVIVMVIWLRRRRRRSRQVGEPVKVEVAPSTRRVAPMLEEVRPSQGVGAGSGRAAAEREAGGANGARPEGGSDRRRELEPRDTAAKGGSAGAPSPGDPRAEGGGAEDPAADNPGARAPSSGSTAGHPQKSTAPPVRPTNPRSPGSSTGPSAAETPERQSREQSTPRAPGDD